MNNSDNWDEELDHFKGSLFMANTWLSVVSNNERLPVYLRFIEDDKSVAILGGLELSVGQGSAKQLFFYSGIAARTKDSSLIKRCKIALYDYARKNGYQRISMKYYGHHSYVPARVKQFKERKKLEYVFRLDRDRDSIINDFSKNVRRRARKAKGEGAVLINSYSIELIESLFRLIRDTYNVRLIFYSCKLHLFE